MFYRVSVSLWKTTSPLEASGTLLEAQKSTFWVHLLPNAFHEGELGEGSPSKCVWVLKIRLCFNIAALGNGRHLCCCLSFFNSVGLLFFSVFGNSSCLFFQVGWHCACTTRGATDWGDVWHWCKWDSFSFCNWQGLWEEAGHQDHWCLHS